MAKTDVEIRDITGKTPAQIEAALESALSDGWVLLEIVVVGAKTFAVLSKTITL